MGMREKPFLVMSLLAMVSATVISSPGRAAGQDSARKTTTTVAPAYPDSARRMQLTGTVRLAAMVAASGQVTNTEVIGGHPILVAAAHDAVMRWRYQAAKRASREVLVFAFAPR